MYRRLVLILILVISFTYSLTATTSPVSAATTCLTDSGNGDIDVWYGPMEIKAGITISATMTTDPGDGIAFGVFVDGNLIYASVIYATPHSASYTFSEDTANVEIVLDWEYNGQPSNTYVFSIGCVSQPNPQVGMISISTAQAQPVYESAGGSVVRDAGGNELWLPQDYDGNGFDTHVVMSSVDIDGQIWYELFIGDGLSTVWVPANNVTVVE